MQNGCHGRVLGLWIYMTNNIREFVYMILGIGPELGVKSHQVRLMHTRFYFLRKHVYTTISCL